MMIALAFAALLQSNAVMEDIARRTQAEQRALSDAVSSWDRCLSRAVDKYAVSEEPADVVASIAMWVCSRHRNEVFDAQVAFHLAARPGLDEQEVRIQLRTDPANTDPTGEEGRRERTTYEVVAKRMGLPTIPTEWDAPL